MNRSERPGEDLVESKYGRIQDLSAEMSVLGAIILENDSFQLIPEVTAEDFSDPRNSKLFSIMDAMLKAGVSVDLVTLKAELGRLGVLDLCGGMQYVASLID